MCSVHYQQYKRKRCTAYCKDLIFLFLSFFFSLSSHPFTASLIFLYKFAKCISKLELMQWIKWIWPLNVYNCFIIIKTMCDARSIDGLFQVCHCSIFYCFFSSKCSSVNEKIRLCWVFRWVIKDAESFNWYFLFSDISPIFKAIQRFIECCWNKGMLFDWPIYKLLKWEICWV